MHAQNQEQSGCKHHGHAMGSNQQANIHNPKHKTEATRICPKSSGFTTQLSQYSSNVKTLLGVQPYGVTTCGRCSKSLCKI